MSVPSTPLAQPTQKTSHRTRNIVIGVIVIVLVLVIGIGIGTSNKSSPSQVSTQVSNSPITVQVVSSGTVLPINAGHSTYYQFTLPGPPFANQTIWYTVTGSFTATNSITAYIMGPSDFSAFSSGSPYSYYYTTGKVSSGGINTNLNGGTYYLVFENTNLITESSTTITQSIIASGTPQS